MQGPREDIIMRKLREPSISNKKSRTLIVFDGDYPVGWIARDENFFEVRHTCSWVKVHLTLICKQGEHTIHWFQFLRKQYLKLIWVEPAADLLRHFGGCNEGSPLESLAILTQDGSMEDHVRSFIVLNLDSLIIELPKDQVLGY